jgi:tetratricopeptide (TPR) repeat protein
MLQRALTTVVVSILTSTGIPLAQYQVDRSGANDANNRIGSGGRNVRSEQPKPWQLANDIVYGNVTGGKAFRGRLGSTDPRAFRGSTATSVSDNFIRQSSGVSTSGMASFNATETQPFFGDSRAVPPPPGMQMIPGGGGWVPPTPTPWRTTDPRKSTLTSSVEMSFRPDLFAMPGPIDSQFNPGAIVVPSVVQAQSLNPGQLSDYTQLNTSSRIAPELLNQLRSEVGEPVSGQNPSTPTQESRPTDPNRLDSELLAQGLDDQIKPAQTSDAIKTGAIRSDPMTEVGVQYRLISPENQSRVYAQLVESARNRPARPGEANARAANEFNQAIRARNESNASPGDSDQPTPRANPNQPDLNNPDDNAPNVGPDVMKPPRFESLVDDKKSALNQLLERAEKQMREGKFNSAIDTYEQAQQIAPNNPLIKLGRAHAELGGGYYRRAELSLRQTLSADKNLLAGQYDLRAFIGADRLKVIEQDLRELVEKNTNDTGAAILLSYVYYNTANERRAAALLDLAEQRSQGRDPFVKVLKSNWTLPSSEPLDLNK